MICAKLAAIGRSCLGEEEIRIPVSGGIKHAPKKRQSQSRATNEGKESKNGRGIAVRQVRALNQRQIFNAFGLVYPP